MSATAEELREAPYALNEAGKAIVAEADAAEEARNRQIGAETFHTGQRYRAAAEAVEITGEARIAAARAFIAAARADDEARAEYVAALRKERALGITVEDAYQTFAIRSLRDPELRALKTDFQKYGRL